MARTISSFERYFPVPTISRDRSARSAMTSGASSAAAAGGRFFQQRRHQQRVRKCESTRVRKSATASVRCGGPVRPRAPLAPRLPSPANSAGGDWRGRRSRFPHLHSGGTAQPRTNSGGGAKYRAGDSCDPSAFQPWRRPAMRVLSPRRRSEPAPACRPRVRRRHPAAPGAGCRRCAPRRPCAGAGQVRQQPRDGQPRGDLARVAVHVDREGRRDRSVGHLSFQCFRYSSPPRRDPVRPIRRG